eukprot:scaffold6944_cov118-Isochrysis_galbana.AAC.1
MADVTASASPPPAAAATSSLESIESKSALACCAAGWAPAPNSAPLRPPPSRGPPPDAPKPWPAVAGGLTARGTVDGSACPRSAGGRVEGRVQSGSGGLARAEARVVGGAAFPPSDERRPTQGLHQIALLVAPP